MNFKSENPLINFELKHCDQITPADQDGSPYLSWFYLTDGHWWFKLGQHTVYEYSEAALEFRHGSNKYCDYYLARFIEDFTMLFNAIAESVPESLYIITADLSKFAKKCRRWFEEREEIESYSKESLFDWHEEATSWLSQRTLSSEYLKGGPYLTFVRCEYRLRIIWNSEQNMDDGRPMWKDRAGSFEMDYLEFVDSVREFGEAFFERMTGQIAQVVTTNWEKIKVDKIRLIEENQERKQDFFNCLLFLKYGSSSNTNWRHIADSIALMKS